MDTTAIIAIIVAILGCLGTVVKIAMPIISAKLTTAQMTAIKLACEVLIYGAEKLYEGTSQGKSKKEYVMTMLKKMFKNADEAVLDAVIEFIGEKNSIFGK